MDTVILFIKQLIDITTVDIILRNKRMNSKVTIVECVVGVFAFDDQNKDIDAVFFTKDIEKMVEAVIRLQREESVDEVIILMERLVRKGYNNFIFENYGLKTVGEQFGDKISIEKPSKAGEHLRSNRGKFAVKRGFVTNLKEFYTLVHDVSVAIAKKGVKEASSNRVLLLSQAAYTLNDLNKTFNLFANRLREWYGYYFPELRSFVVKSDVYVRLIASLGKRKNFSVEKLNKFGMSTQKARAICAAAKASMGADMAKKDVDEIHSFSNTLLELYASRDKIERYLDNLMKEVAPNLRELAGSTLGACLIAAAGGLERLSKKASSTIQVLGAEKALFRSLKTGTRPPKHGLIFQHNDIHQSPKWQRGKIARALAGKIAIAARLDFHRGEYRGGKLKEEYDKRVKEIKTKYAKSP